MIYPQEPQLSARGSKAPLKNVDYKTILTYFVPFRIILIPPKSINPPLDLLNNYNRKATVQGKIAVFRARYPGSSMLSYHRNFKIEINHPP